MHLIALEKPSVYVTVAHHVDALALPRPLDPLSIVSGPVHVFNLPVTMWLTLCIFLALILAAIFKDFLDYRVRELVGQ